MIYKYFLMSWRSFVASVHDFAAWSASAALLFLARISAVNFLKIASSLSCNGMMIVSRHQGTSNRQTYSVLLYPGRCELLFGCSGVFAVPRSGSFLLVEFGAKRLDGFRMGGVKIGAGDNKP